MLYRVVRALAVLQFIASTIATPTMRGQNVVHATAGGNYTHFVTADGTLWGLGRNAAGQLGDGTHISRTNPVQIASGVVSVDDSLDHTAFVKTDGTLWTVGTNSEAALGDGTRTERTTPVQIATDVTSVSVDNGHTMFVKRDGTLWGVGTNFFGNLGDGTTTDRLLPVQVAANVRSVSAGVFTSVYIKTDGTLWGAGRNHFGQLGDGTTTQHSIPIQIASNVASASTSGLHTLFVKTDGTLWGMGRNSSGELGDGTNSDRLVPVQVATGVASVSAGFSRTLFVKMDGSLWAMGQNPGVLGGATYAPWHTPVRVMANVRSAAAGRSHGVIVKTDGTLFGFGSDVDGELGPVSSLPFPTPSVPIQIIPAPAPTARVVLSTSDAVGRFVGGSNTPAPVIVDDELTVQSEPPSIAAVNVLLGEITGDLNNLGEELRLVVVPPTMGNITAQFDWTNKVLTLRSEDCTATLQQWQTALRSVTYVNLSPIPLSGSREIVFAAHNGVIGSPLVSKWIRATWVAASPESIAASAGASVDLSGTINVPGSVHWQRNGSALAGATTATYTLTDLRPDSTGLYTLVSDAYPVATDAAIVGLISASRVIGTGEVVGSDIPHPNGNRFDQVLLTGEAETVTAEFTADRITRTSFIDLDNDIVQIEFSGPGTLSLVLDGASGPTVPQNYNQPTVSYMKGHAGLVIVGADERTNVSVFSVGRATAFDPTGEFDFLQPISPSNNPANNRSSLFLGHRDTNYDGIADLAFIAISSTNGKFGGIRAANAHFFASKGLTGIYAPGVSFQGPVFVGDITAFDLATPVLRIGGGADTRITGGDLQQDNGKPVQVGGLTQLRFTPGSDSGGNTHSAQRNQAVLVEDGVDRTSQIVIDP